MLSEKLNYRIPTPPPKKVREDKTSVSESREKKRRYNERLEYIAHFEKWMKEEPPVWRLLAWHKWQKNRPVRKQRDRLKG